MIFSHPLLAACALAIVPAAYVAQHVANMAWRRMAIVSPDLTFLTSALQAPSWPVIVLDASSSAGVALLLLAAAGPHVPVVSTVRDAAIVLCIDTSGSMRASDVHPTRAAAALHAARSFAAGLAAGTKIGVVSFAHSADVLELPNADRTAVREALAALPAPNGQTALGDGLRAALRMLPSAGTRSIVLVTDGVSNTGEDPSGVLRDLRAARVRVYAIGLGESPVAERLLRSEAAITGGSFARIGSAAQFPAAFARIAEAVVHRRQVRDVSEVTALAGLFLLAAAWLASAWAGRVSFLGEPELHEPLGHLDDAPQLRRAGRDRDRRRADRIPARVD